MFMILLPDLHEVGAVFSLYDAPYLTPKVELNPPIQTVTFQACRE